MSNYKLLKQKITKSLPRLMELSKGCIVKNYKGVTFEVIKAVIDGDDDDFIVYSDANLLLNSVRVLDLPEHKVKILGKEPMLNDVLEWLKGLNIEIHSINKYGLFHDRNWNGILYWDFSSPYLKDQNQELIDYLCTLG